MKGEALVYPKHDPIPDHERPGIYETFGTEREAESWASPNMRNFLHWINDLNGCVDRVKRELAELLASKAAFEMEDLDIEDDEVVEEDNPVEYY